MGGTKKQQRQATSLGNLGDESQGDGHWEGHFGKEGGGRETSGLETSNRSGPRLHPHPPPPHPKVEEGLGTEAKECDPFEWGKGVTGTKNSRNKPKEA